MDLKGSMALLDPKNFVLTKYLALVYREHTLGNCFWVNYLTRNSFNRIDLPAYSSKEELRRKLTMAADNCEGFEIQ
jgi:hypothetical protein